MNVYPAIGKVAIINNTADEQRTTVYDGNGNPHSMILRSEELRWESYDENSIII
ncbi:hypothetical protein MGH68_04855 [Erysipelothrix sp. D19-032]